ncbi:hypothetical protein Dip518_000760 [Parelusimicrobium proximum]|uniref:hypothetical protein n=1 Tax=Parelusimicrobium proximum TaxID=3228953 RepID=UPI003D181522
MKKLLGLVLVLALVVPAKADVLKNLTTSGEIQVLGTYDRNMLTGAGSTVANPSGMYADPDGNYSQVALRVLLGVHANLTQDVQANLTFAYYNMWGNQPDATTGVGNPSTGTTGKSINDYLEDVDVLEANIVITNLFCALEAKIGRQFYGDEDSAIIYFGPNHYNSEQRDFRQATALDAVKLSYAGESLAVDFIYGKLYEAGDSAATPVNNTQDNDGTLIGLDAKYAITDNIKIQGYVYNFRFAEEADDEAVHSGVWGLKPSFQNDMLKASVEYARSMDGDRPFRESHDNGYMIKADASVNFDAITPRAALVIGKEFSGMLGNYRPGLIYGQTYIFDMVTPGAAHMLDDAGIANLAVDVKLPSMDKFTFTADAYAFANRTFSHAADYEVDVWVKYAQTENIEWHVAAGAMKIAGWDRNPTKVQSGVIVKF